MYRNHFTWWVILLAARYGISTCKKHLSIPKIPKGIFWFPLARVGTHHFGTNSKYKIRQWRWIDDQCTLLWQIAVNFVSPTSCRNGWEVFWKPLRKDHPRSCRSYSASSDSLGSSFPSPSKFAQGQRCHCRKEVAHGAQGSKVQDRAGATDDTLTHRWCQYL